MDDESHKQGRQVDRETIKMEKVQKSMLERTTAEGVAHWRSTTKSIAMMMKTKEQESAPRRTTCNRGLGDLKDSAQQG